MSFERSALDPDFANPEPAKKRPEKPRGPDGRYRKTRKGGHAPWVPSDEYCQMVTDTLIAEGVPKSRFRINRRKRYVRLKWRCRGYDEIHFVFRQFYTPHHVRRFLELYMRWYEPGGRIKNGRPRNPPKPPKDWSLDRRTKKWRRKRQMFHEYQGLVTGDTYPLRPVRERGRRQSGE